MLLTLFTPFVSFLQVLAAVNLEMLNKEQHVWHDAESADNETDEYQSTDESDSDILLPIICGIV